MASMMNSALMQVNSLAQSMLDRYRALPRAGKIVFWAITIINNLFILTLLYLGPGYVFHEFAIWASELRDLPFGFLWIIIAMTFTSLPPLIGYGTLITICGFTWGLQGWWIAATGCMTGSAFSFLVCRRYTKSFQTYLEQEPRFVALGSAVRHKGLPLLTLIRCMSFSVSLQPVTNALTVSMSISLHLQQSILRFDRKRYSLAIHDCNTSNHT